VFEVLDRLRKLLGLAGLLAAMTSAFGALLAHGGRWSDFLDVSSHFMPVWLTAGLIGGLLSFGLLRQPYKGMGLTAGLTAALASALIMGPEMAPRLRPKAPDTGPVLKIVQFNIWRSNQDPKKTLDWILAQNADIVMIEEAEMSATPIRSALIQRYPNWSSSGIPMPHSVMVLSRLPMTDRGADSGPPMAFATYRWQGRELMAVALHQYWPIPVGPQQWQLKRLARNLAHAPQGNMIMGGDFNSAPWSFNLRRLDSRLHMTRRTHGIATWPAGPVSRFRLPPLFPFLAIDQIYAGPGWKTVSVTRGPRLGSDHYPVIIKLAPVN
jgi:endonuclease/exonuclease/phosphatase (EEP) superfamily protein YafD